jgi:hypothetical protein
MGITMRGDQLPYQDHISRYCAPKTLADGQPTGTSFMLRQDEEYLSVNWLEYFDHIGMSAQINQIREHIELSLASSGLFAVLNIGETIDYIQSNSEKHLAILYEPTSGDPSHSGIYDYRHEDDLVADLIAEIVIETHPSKKI